DAEYGFGIDSRRVYNIFLMHSLSVWCDSAFSLFKRVKGICLRASLLLCQLVERIFSMRKLSYVIIKMSKKNK
ncbi:hypothetical protein P4U44_10710, partial [Alkalihalobacillus alcalophilus]|uniref:hypothetical protein n=1 Tax=Alkalihalobacillus alcalophilus TaxID=1445 RepID=UPI002E225134|nr:hypothetical protein [Alkalihalobacillus alcalophilus]